MASEAEVANMAAARLGSETRITSLDDDRTLASSLKAIWAAQRRATIREGSWNFAAKRGTLNHVAGVNPVDIYPYASAFRVPADCVRLIEILDPVARADFQYEGGRVICNSAGPLYARWSIDVPEPALWDDAFAEAFSCRLAWKIGRKIIGPDFDANSAWREYQAALTGSRGVDAKENPPIAQEESDWVTARLGGWGA